MQSLSKGLWFWISALLTAATLSGCSTPIASVSSPTDEAGLYIAMRDVTKVELALDCERLYRISGDPYRVSASAGFYCVDGLAANFRVFKVYESSATSKLAAQDYESVQTGGRKLTTGKNWFLLGLELDFQRLEALKLEPQQLAAFPPAQPLQDNCMLQVTSLVESLIQEGDADGDFATGIDAAIPGALLQAKSVSNARRGTLAKAFASQDPFSIEQELAEASKSYRNFCSSR